MHSSRMRTGRSLTVVPGRGVLSPGDVLSPGGVLSPRGVYLVLGDVLSPGGSGSGGCLLWGVSAQGVSAPGGVACSRGCVCVSQHALRQTPPLLTESQMPVKTLPWLNLVATGNYSADQKCKLLPKFYGLVYAFLKILHCRCYDQNNDFGCPVPHSNYAMITKFQGILVIGLACLYELSSSFG